METKEYINVSTQENLKLLMGQEIGEELWSEPCYLLKDGEDLLLVETDEAILQGSIITKDTDYIDLITNGLPVLNQRNPSLLKGLDR